MTHQNGDAKNLFEKYEEFYSLKKIYYGMISDFDNRRHRGGLLQPDSPKASSLASSAPCASNTKRSLTK